MTKPMPTKKNPDECIFFEPNNDIGRNGKILDTIHNPIMCSNVTCAKCDTCGWNPAVAEQRKAYISTHIVDIIQANILRRDLMAGNVETVTADEPEE